MYELTISDPVSGEVVRGYSLPNIRQVESRIVLWQERGMVYSLTADGQPLDPTEYAYRLSQGL